ncbi:RNase adapter RapZ [Lactobacillus sp. LC28-10]|uniref:RNase adapter RapZ n=1 Tax=Secundilactobacillus angelensis TaxID=2722706 RepID=A0ABX1KWN3_9LACO|nr:RNase adapter RapZ [Secundilactobacillus angelensis]MCH5462178.1 RNase adapter RapZ [Secundilactobacillus angelensis]NLR18342.1 RNase adapter RapZ [Secundilactobacillus angelensis]
MNNDVQLVIISGMSGAGKTVAMQAFEDLGYFCIDNMPSSLMSKFWELVQETGKIKKVAVVIDLRTKAFYDETIQMTDDISNLNRSDSAQIVFLDADDETLVSRYKETRRSHPLARNGRVVDGIKAERKLLAPLKQAAQLVINTTQLSPRKLRAEIFHNFEAGDIEKFHIELMSFGFKYGLPIDADIVMDVRFLPNPYYLPELKNLTGLDQPVYDYVMKQPETESFYNQFLGLLKSILPGYKREGKNNLTIAIGCTGGQHRSVALAERVGNALGDNYPVHITHRDISKRKESN